MAWFRPHLLEGECAGLDAHGDISCTASKISRTHIPAHFVAAVFIFLKVIIRNKLAHGD